ncbi:sensor histidine kinase [Actinomadura litoris]|uniref:histidine kinase n=1 Tax=Actinomadura litoris TaxID=2678616 RepID=A0A7K1L2F6_9ACTN|nr:sensor histidine kinase [Actinomadura litoris]MUN38591.1 sensor histidine kinase [Actinomadura litoris]
MVATRTTPLLRRSRPSLWTILAWCGAALYPAVLNLVVGYGAPGLTRIEIVPAAALTLVVASLLRRHPLPAVTVLLVAWGAACLVAGTVAVALVEMLTTDLAVGYVAVHHPRRTSLTAAAMAFCTQVATIGLFPGTDVASRGVLILVALVAAWTVGNSARERREHARELSERATAQAVTAERLRIARELHDMVAHSIGIIAIQAGVGSRVIDTQPGEARNALDAIEATSREALSGLRRMLGALRRADEPGTAPLDPAPGLADLDRLVAATADAGVRVDLRWRGERRPLPPDIDLSAFRIIQEALTNVVRHAGTSDCEVRVGYLDDELSVEIVDDGIGVADPGAGYGLVGMRERAGLLKGDLTAGPRPGGGFRVAARLPLEAR